MTDDFVKKAFADADKARVDEEFNAYMASVGGKTEEAAHVTAAMRVGLSRMEKLCKLVIESGNADVLAEYAHTLLLVGFHSGYTAAIGGGEG